MRTLDPPGRSRTVAVGRITDEDEAYAALCDHACRVARRLVSDRPPRSPSPPARYLLSESARLVRNHPDRGRAAPAGAAVEALDAIARAWADVRAGRRSGEEILTSRPALWERLMNEWPLGRYAELVAASLRKVPCALDVVVELGAGVGATTRRIRPVVAERGGSIVATDRLYGGSRRVDFDRPLAGQVPTADVVVATNALHCARDPGQTLRWIREVLRPGGLLVLGEGAPFPEPGVPWALNLVFGACRGWFDRGGFRPPECWLDSLRAAGFASVFRQPWPSERYELGGSFVARAPS